MDQDFYDYAVAAAVPDDDFYYVSWEDPIYDVFEEYDYSGMCHLKSHKKRQPFSIFNRSVFLQIPQIGIEDLRVQISL